MNSEKITAFLLSPLNLFFVGFLLLMFVFLFNALVYRDSPAVYLSSAFISTNDTTKEVAINFDLNQKEKQKFTSLVESFGVDWAGEPVGVKVNENLYSFLKHLNSSNIGLQLNDNELKISGTLKSFSTKLTDLQDWGQAAFVPEDTFFFWQGPNVADFLPAKLKSLISTKASLALIPVDGSSNLVVISSIEDKKTYDDTIASLEKESDDETKETDFKLTSGAVETVKVYNFNQNGVVPYTIGVVDDKLVVTTGEEAFRKVIKTKNDVSPDLGSNGTYLKSIDSVGEGGVGVYFRPQSLNLANSNKNLEGVIDLKNSDEVMLKKLQDKIEALCLVITPSLKLQGVVNWK